MNKDIKIGTLVINNSPIWCSGFMIKARTLPDSKWIYVNKQLDSDKRSKLIADGYSDCSDNNRVFGIKGVVVDYDIDNDIYLVKWDNGGLCGKPDTSLEIDYQSMRDIKLKELGI